MASTLGQEARFDRAVTDARQLPADRGREVAFAGRSNAGKSTAVNAILGRRGLARTSKTPGRTRQIVCFDLGAGRRVVDLPGYGFARVPERVRLQWRPMVEAYLRGRRSLAGLVVVMDVRRPCTDLDLAMLEWCASAGVATLALLAKADKLGRGARAGAVATARRRAAETGCAPDVLAFSAPQGLGLEEARAHVGGWLAGA